jgi:hypothetical protein
MMWKRSSKVFVLLIGYFALLPALATGPKEVVGKIVSSSRASLDEIMIPDGGTILIGDTLSTSKGGNALVKLSATTQASLSGGTTVFFGKNADRLSAKVSSGTLVIETLGKDAPIVETALYTTEPAEPGKAVYLVAVLPDKSTVITARHGKVSIRDISSGRSYLLPEGYSAVPQGSSDDPGQEEQPKQAPGLPAGQSREKPPEIHNSHRTLIIILAAGAAGGVGAAVAASGGGGGAPASPSGP